MFSLSCASDPKRPYLKLLPFHSRLISRFYSQISRPTFLLLLTWPALSSELTCFFFSHYSIGLSLSPFHSWKPLSFPLSLTPFWFRERLLWKVLVIEAESVLTVRVIGNINNLTESEIKLTSRRLNEGEWEVVVILESREKQLHWKFAMVSAEVSTKSLDWSIQMEGVLRAISLHWQN